MKTVLEAVYDHFLDSTALFDAVAGKLYLPVKPKIRTDKSPEECGYEQIQALQTNKAIIQTTN